ncbi:MAG TPA: hypothetical protein VF638_12810 [Sphingomonas sp.]
MAAGLVAAAFLLAMVVLVVGSLRVAEVRRGAVGYLIAALSIGGGAAPPPTPPPPASAQAIARGLLVDPLDPMLVNAGVYADAVRAPSHAPPAAKLAALAHLGWRYTPAVQNRIYAAALAGDLAGTAGLAEALLRRRTIIDQATAFMNLIEGDATARPLLAAKLVGDPRWRTDYLQAVDQLRTPAQIRARGELALQLQAAGSRLRRDELGPITSKLAAAGMTDIAYWIWRNDTRAPETPLNDPDFARLYALRETDVLAMPFEWILRSDDGAWTEVRRAGSALVDIHWDGRGAPVFLQQQTFLTPGPYRLRIAGPDARAGLLAKLAFEAHCGNALPVRFDRPIRVGAGAMLVASQRPIACRDPIVFVVGIAPENRPSGFSGLVEGDEGVTVTLAGLRLVAGR